MPFPTNEAPIRQENGSSSRLATEADYGPDISELFGRFCRGFYQILGLGLVGLAIAATAFFIFSPFQTVQTTTRVVFSFNGFERGVYPDGSKFQADDLRAPAIVGEAMRRLGLDTSEDAQSKIRSALSIEGVIPDNIVKARDRLRSMGQTPPPYLPDEYMVTLALSRSYPLNGAQRERLLVEIINVARENFKRTYGQLPVAFGTAFDTLRGADFPEYEIVFNSEINNLTAYLSNQIEIAKSFRSPTTNLSFKDLLEQVRLFAELDLNETLGLIHRGGLARDRQDAILKLDYRIRDLGYDEQLATDDEKVVRDLLHEAESREQNYVLGVKSQVVTRPGEQPILDQGLVDSLVANDAYNYLVRQALQAGLKVRQIQSDKLRVSEVRDNLEAFEKSKVENQKSMMDRLLASLTKLQDSYNRLVSSVRKTHADFADQEYGHAIQISAQVHSTSLFRSLAIAGLAGAFLGCALGSGLSLLGIYLGKGRPGA